MAKLVDAPPLRGWPPVMVCEFGLASGTDKSEELRVEGENDEESPLQVKSYAFALRIIKLCHILKKRKRNLFLTSRF